VLYRPEAFEPLAGDAWDVGRVRADIAEIVSDADAAYEPASLWPAHEWDAWTLPLPVTNLYVGAAGVIWALDALRRRGHAETVFDVPAAAMRTLETWRERPGLPAGIELPQPAEASLLCGESGILAVAWRLARDDSLADDLHAHVVANARNPAAELMWGAPGTMLAGRALLDWTGDRRWADAWRASAEDLWLERDAEGLWTQRLYGAEYRGLSAPHGVVGNALALLRGRELLDDGRRRTLERETAEAVARYAVFEDGLANWPDSVDEPLSSSDGQIRVQWCVGAPGIVASTAGYLDEELLLAGAELAWRTGPPGLEKGPSICHGTAGHGYAFLKTFERTGDERWLERARRFAVHALEQVSRLRTERGRGRYSLWTGDLGVALFAADCLDGNTEYPVIETWD
jgi:hypothetical protein